MRPHLGWLGLGPRFGHDFKVLLEVIPTYDTKNNLFFKALRKTKLLLMLTYTIIMRCMGFNVEMSVCGAPLGKEISLYLIYLSVATPLAH